MFLALTLHKMPVLILRYYFLYDFNINLLLVGVVLTHFLRGLLILATSDLRMLIIISSLANSS